MAVTISDIQFDPVKQPLKQPFLTVLQRVEAREVTIVTLRDTDGREGYGECVAFDTPWYTEETVAGSRFVMEQVLAPLLIDQRLAEPSDADRLFSSVKGNRMAKAAMEMAVWDLFAKSAGLPLHLFVGGTAEPVPAGVVVAAESGEIESRIQQAVDCGYRRIKLKISPTSDAALLEKVIKNYPDTSFYADANGSFSGHRLEVLQKFDQVGFSLIEQPYEEQQWILHRDARKTMKTQICLDESIASLEDAKRMVEQQAGDIIVLKMGRLGGWTETLKLVEFCRQQQVEMWVGGMIEFGISKAHNLALASLPEIKLTGDFSASDHFWKKDIIAPEIRVEQGEIKLSQDPGIGYRLTI
ncbi:o-succinylbenzoate synthase [Planococcus sp. ISL-109]|uniref:o-succinylbenzoate synthase n=1 Tax=Planococcus sp. ISL-109 TaxID=2819166 RepID=UPI001BEA4405|nr:o-succinylbenzoate synthase [Planococcus sp. ISL-109]MBT2582586.1 o-succinylbenzoate synthase [Planococcus sp. ISL-109]